MAAVHIRQVPEEVLAALKERATRNGRSMQQELIVILKAAAASDPPVAEVVPLQLETVRTERQEPWSREDIYGDEGR